jgi:propionate CoA-transferase
LEIEASGGRLRIVREGRARKLLPDVEQVAFNGRLGVERGQRVLYLTERAVFELQLEGLLLREVAPGIDVARDIVAMLPPGVGVSPEPAKMDPRIFETGAFEASVA